MFEFFSADNKVDDSDGNEGVEDSSESIKQVWEELEFDSLPDPDEIVELVNAGTESKELLDLLQTVLGESIDRIQIPPSLSESLTLYIFKEDRDPNKKTEDYQLNLKKDGEGYKWSSAVKYIGDK